VKNLLAIEIGVASMDFLLQENEDDILTLYVDSLATSIRYNSLENFSAYFIETIVKRAGLEPESMLSSLKIFSSLLRANGEEDLMLIMKDEGLDTSQVLKDRKFDYTFKPSLGETIPDDWVHRLQADLLNTFRPQELVGYEMREDSYVFARIEHKAHPLPEEENMDTEMEKYVIRIRESIGESDTENQCTITVPVIELYKILRIMDLEPEVECKELKLYDPDNEFVLNWEANKDIDLKDIHIKICDELKRIGKITDENLKRKCLKAMFLKWHPDKNNHPLATKAFQFLQRQIDRMKKGLDLEDPERNESPSTNMSSEYYSNEWFTSWENLYKARSRSYQREERTYRNFFRESNSTHGEDWFGFSPSSPEGISVSPDPSKAEVWKEQARHDLSAMKIMHDEASLNNIHLSAHVCYLAHQLAEKSLKAGMYAKNGLHPNSLKHHDLLVHASALEQVDSNASGLMANARLLNDYYLKTRYPNQYSPHRVPSQLVSLEEAEQAARAGEKIYDIVNRIW